MSTPTDETSPRADDSHIVLPLDAAKTTTALAAMAVALTVVGVATNLYYASSHRPTDRVQRFLDVNGEGNLPTWFSVVLLALAAAATAAVAATRPGTSGTASVWYLLAALIGLMSLDEMTGMHEAVGRFVDEHIDELRLGQYAWVLPGAMVAIGCAHVLRRAVRQCAPAVRARLLSAGLLFVVGALGIEVVEALLVNDRHNALGDGMHLLTGTQELVEMIAVIAFLGAMLEQIRHAGSHASTSTAA